MRSLRPFSLAAFLIVTAACTAESSDEDDTGDNIEDLTAKACEVGRTCPSSIRVSSPVLYANGVRAPKRFREDLRASVAPPDEETPRWFRRTTTRAMTLGAEHALVIAGGTTGSESFAVDDFLLVEVLSPEGARLAAGQVGDPAVTLDGAPVTRLAPRGAWRGATLGYAQAPVDISTIIPKGAPFRLRVSVLDVGGEAFSSDIFVVAKTASAPPPPPANPPPPPAPPPPAPPLTDPFDPTFCRVSMTTAQAAAKFERGTTVLDLGQDVTVASRRRSCKRLTGCAAWEPTTQVSYINRPPPGLGALTGEWMDFPASTVGRARLVVDAIDIRLDLALTNAGQGLRLTSHPFTIIYPRRPTYVGPCSDTLCSNGEGALYGGEANQVAQRVTVGEHCLRAQGVRRFNERDGNYSEFETAITGKF